MNGNNLIKISKYFYLYEREHDPILRLFTPKKYQKVDSIASKSMLNSLIRDGYLSQLKLQKQPHEGVLTC